jgi:hypothetical protein
MLYNLDDIFRKLSEIESELKNLNHKEDLKRDWGIPSLSHIIFLFLWFVLLIAVIKSGKTSENPNKPPTCEVKCNP